MLHPVNHPQAPAIINLVNSVQHSFGGSHFPEISRGLHYQLPYGWSKQTVEVKKKANKMLGVLQRNLAWVASYSRTVKERSYLSLVRAIFWIRRRCLVSIYTVGHHLRRIRSASRSGYPVTSPTTKSNLVLRALFLFGDEVTTRSPPRNVYLNT